jgi:very-short-patch-repair endonuclease
VVALYQLPDLGLSSSQIHRLSTHHGWARITTMVLRRVGSPKGDAQEVTAAVLDSGDGAFLSHESAAAFWGHLGCRLLPPQVTTDRPSSRRSALARVHRVRAVDRRWVTTLHGIPVARPELTVLQLFATMPDARAERIADALWSRRLFSGRSLGLALGELAARGRNGVAGLRRYWEARGDVYVPPASGLESRFAKLMAREGIPFRRQVDLGSEAWTGRVDFLHARLPVVVEIQSALHHAALTDQVADAKRVASLHQDGFRVVEILDTELWNSPDLVVRRVRAALPSPFC